MTVLEWVKENSGFNPVSKCKDKSMVVIGIGNCPGVVIEGKLNSSKITLSVIEK